MASLTDPKIARKISDTASCYDSVMDIMINDILNPAIEIAGKRGFRHIVIKPDTIQKHLPEFGDILSFIDLTLWFARLLTKPMLAKRLVTLSMPLSISMAVTATSIGVPAATSLLNTATNTASEFI